MSVTYGFYNSIEGDRKYNATHLGTLFDGIIVDGIFSTWGEQFNVTPTDTPGCSCIVHTGKAWLNNTWTINDTLLTFSASNGDIIPVVNVSGRKRIDAIVITVDKEERTNSIDYVMGTDSATPVRPDLMENQYPIAFIELTGTAGSVIQQQNITNVVGLDRNESDIKAGGTPFVTGLLQQMTTDQLLEQWDAAFNVWFDSIRDLLNEDAVANLQYEIENLILSGSTPLTDDAVLQDGAVYFQYED